MTRLQLRFGLIVFIAEADVVLIYRAEEAILFNLLKPLIKNVK